MNRLGRLSPSTSLFFLCDIQKVFESLIFNMARVEQTAIFMSRTAALLDVPTIVTEHNKKAFGPILESIKSQVDPQKSHWFEKLKFSMFTDEVEEYLTKNYPQRRSVILSGIETHVCVQQTALDLIAKGYEVHVVADGVSSQREHDRTVAIERIRQSGGFVSSSESIIFELANDAKNPKFKSLLPLFKEKRVSEFQKL